MNVRIMLDELSSAEMGIRNTAEQSLHELVCEIKPVIRFNQIS
jgi:hypothetical protein